MWSLFCNCVSSCRGLDWLCLIAQDRPPVGAALRLTDIAEALHGDWVLLATQLGISPREIVKIQTEFGSAPEQVGSKTCLLNIFNNLLFHNKSSEDFEASLFLPVFRMLFLRLLIVFCDLVENAF